MTTQRTNNFEGLVERVADRMRKVSTRPVTLRLGMGRQRLRIAGISSVLAGVVLLTACGGDSAPQRLPPSVQVEQEAGQNGRITLTQEAVDRLKLKVEQVANRPITMKRPAEVLYLPELGGQVNANDNGTVLAPPNGTLPKPGDQVAAGQVLVRIQPLGGGPTIDVASPRNGTFVRLRAGTGQSVAPGQALFEVADLSRVWIWVPVSAMDLARVQQDRPIRVKPTPQAASSFEAVPVPAPASLVGLSLFYRLDAANHGLFPGQRIEVELAESAASRRVIPYSAVVYDSSGAGWVYTSGQSNVFERRPVSIELIEGSLAVLSDGPATGSFVVTVGAAELFASEAGVGLRTTAGR